MKSGGRCAARRGRAAAPPPPRCTEVSDGVLPLPELTRCRIGLCGELIRRKRICGVTGRPPHIASDQSTRSSVSADGERSPLVRKLSGAADFGCWNVDRALYTCHRRGSRAIGDRFLVTWATRPKTVRGERKPPTAQSPTLKHHSTPHSDQTHPEFGPRRHHRRPGRNRASSPHCAPSSLPTLFQALVARLPKWSNAL